MHFDAVSFSTGTPLMKTSIKIIVNDEQCFFINHVRFRFWLLFYISSIFREFFENVPTIFQRFYESLIVVIQ